ncbi:polysaccharide pyruvyl transferase family protein [Candidatus Pseudothioglobus singularis]|jgi:hypothetical protein|nr:polysaccharide pyruvyl transferase family protein [Candidatus Pseudothioglobus singularis]
MKIGILTYFDGINYGAFAQVYALQSKLTALGFDTEVIAYKGRKHEINEYKSLFLTKKYKIFINNFEKLRVFRNAQKSLNKTLAFSRGSRISNLNFDKIIIGSDEVWNFKNDLFGLDLTYFGEGFIKKNSVISYAASFGSILASDYIPDEVKNNLLKFSAVSVRDDNSFKLVSNFLTDVKKVTDPTFLYDFKEELIDMAEYQYLLFYGITLQQDDKLFIREIKNFASKRNLRIVSVGYFHQWADINFVNIDPFKWLSYIKNADFIVTNMFHGTIFSIKFNKSFVTIASKRRENKVKSLLRDFNLESRLLTSKINLEFKDKITAEIDYKSVNLKIDELISYSENFLIENLNS